MTATLAERFRRIAALDVHYEGGEADAGAAGPGGDETIAWAAAAVFDRIDAAEAVETARLARRVAAAYEPGAFYKRELPALLDVVGALAAPPDLVIVDGCATLGESALPGLGWRLWDALGRAAPVIGVAKSRYRGAPETTELRRGGSKTPLFVTAAGLEQAEALALIAAMHGFHRLPTLLARADQLSRGGAGGV